MNLHESYKLKKHCSICAVMYSRYTQMHQESLSNQSNLLTITEAFMIEKCYLQLKYVYFLPLSHSKAQNKMITGKMFPEPGKQV